MARAFKCDKCEELHEGQPNRHAAHEYLTSGSLGWSDRETIGRAELCDSCSEEFIAAVRELLD